MYNCQETPAINMLRAEIDIPHEYMAYTIVSNVFCMTDTFRVNASPSYVNRYRIATVGRQSARLYIFIVDVKKKKKCLCLDFS